MNIGKLIIVFVTSAVSMRDSALGDIHFVFHRGAIVILRHDVAFFFNSGRELIEIHTFIISGYRKRDCRARFFSPIASFRKRDSTKLVSCLYLFTITAKKPRVMVKYFYYKKLNAI